MQDAKVIYDAWYHCTVDQIHSKPYFTLDNLIEVLADPS
jgi:hypothetical protein